MSARDRELKPVPLPYHSSHNRIAPVAMPTVAEVEALHKPAGRVVADLLALHADMRAATEALYESRYGGRLWLAAEAADRHAVMAGEEPSALPALIAGEPKRYALANALAGTAVARHDARRLSGMALLAKAAQSARAKASEAVAAVEGLARDGWAGRDRAKGLAMLEQAEEELARAERLLAVAQWCEGTGPIAAPGTLHVPIGDEVRGILRAARHDRDGSIPIGRVTGLPADWRPKRVS
jgi:hypothetical protein